MGDQLLKVSPGGITVLMGNRVAGFLCLKRALKYQQCSYTCVTSNVVVSLWYCNYLVFFTGFTVVVGFRGLLLLSFLLLGFFCVASVWFDFFGLVCFCLGFGGFFSCIVVLGFFSNQTSGLKFFKSSLCSGWCFLVLFQVEFSSLSAGYLKTFFFPCKHI